MPPPAALLTHEDDESTLSIRATPPAGYEIAIAREGLRASYALRLTRDALRTFAQDLLQGLESGRRLVEAEGPSDGRTRLAATAAPGEDGELLMVMLAREGKGDEMEAEYVRFASRDQMARFAQALLSVA